jgi:hypothetical protein
LTLCLDSTLLMPLKVFSTEDRCTVLSRWQKHEAKCVSFYISSPKPPNRNKWNLVYIKLAE